MQKKSQTIKPVSQPKITFVFQPVAQNTVIRPMAQAVCIARAGETIRYTDTADHKEKSITLSDLRFVFLQAKIDGRELCFEGQQAVLMAEKFPIRIRVDVNDVQVFVSKKTTVTQAMNDFRKKITAHNDLLPRKKPESRQHE